MLGKSGAVSILCLSNLMFYTHVTNSRLLQALYLQIACGDHGVASRSCQGCYLLNKWTNFPQACVWAHLTLPMEQEKSEAMEQRKNCFSKSSGGQECIFQVIWLPCWGGCEEVWRKQLPSGEELFFGQEQISRLRNRQKSCFSAHVQREGNHWVSLFDTRCSYWSP